MKVKLQNHDVVSVTFHHGTGEFDIPNTYAWGCKIPKGEEGHGTTKKTCRYTEFVVSKVIDLEKKEFEEILRTTAICSPHDQFTRVEGRRHALRKALDYMRTNHWPVADRKAIGRAAIGFKKKSKKRATVSV